MPLRHSSLAFVALAALVVGGSGFIASACGGASFVEAAGEGGAEEDSAPRVVDAGDGGGITVGPPDGAPVPKDGGRDAEEEPDAATDSGVDAPVDSESPSIDSSVPVDSAEPLDSSSLDSSPFDSSHLIDTGIDTGPVDACATEQPNSTLGVFVAQTGTATMGCSIGAPCGTINEGIAAATTAKKTLIYVAKGTYAGQVTVSAAVTLEGGWGYAGGVDARVLGEHRDRHHQRGERIAGGRREQRDGDAQEHQHRKLDHRGHGGVDLRRLLVGLDAYP